MLPHHLPARLDLLKKMHWLTIFLWVQLAQKYKVCLHSDACLGGFVLPFARQLGYNVPDFDFRVPGVTSMSIDTHKFGMAHKGTSVVLYRNPDIRKYQYTQITEWSGGLYISPGLLFLSLACPTGPSSKQAFQSLQKT